jgi:hypothetical protein
MLLEERTRHGEHAGAIFRPAFGGAARPLEIAASVRSRFRRLRGARRPIRRRPY